jgi:ribosomal-protein-alanine N-acetyltransferase
MSSFDCAMHAFATARLRMRPLSEGDEGLYCRLYLDPVVMRFIAEPLRIEAAQRSFGIALRQQNPVPQRWIVSRKNSNCDIGLLGLVGTHGSPEIGVMLVGQEHGRGYGTEAMAGLVEHAFTTTDLQAITASQSFPDNPTVISMMSRLGFTALPPTPARPDGGDWSLNRRDWRGLDVAASYAER